MSSTTTCPKDLLAELTQQGQSRRRWLVAGRWLVRVGCLVILTAILWPGVQLWPTSLQPEIPRWIQTLESPEAARLVPALSTWIALSALLALHTVGLTVGVGLALGLVAMLRPRWFCRWMCPMGVCTELAGRAGRLCRLRTFRLFPVGQWIALLTLAGAVVGYPLLLWMDPLALWAGWITPASIDLVPFEEPTLPPTPAELSQQTPLASQADSAIQPDLAIQAEQATQTNLATSAEQAEWIVRPANQNWFAVGAAAVLVLSFLLPGLWCGRLCPLGGLQEILWQLRQMALALGKGLNRLFRRRMASESKMAGDAELSKKVVGLFRSESKPAVAGALGVGQDKPAGEFSRSAPEQLPCQQTAESGWKFGRRLVLAGLGGAVWAGWTRWLRGAPPKLLRPLESVWSGWGRRAGPSPSKPLRPPGAADESCFTGLCIRCGNCIRACPSRIILPDGARHGLAGFLAPVLYLDKDYCREDCNRCTLSCPSGALQPVLLSEKPKVRIGLAHVDMDRCMLAEARECFICRERCPYQAIRTQFSPITYIVEVQIDPARCNGCGACQVACPTWPRAIVVQPL